jgi:membrane-bound lytic murein transglycosylase B
LFLACSAFSSASRACHRKLPAASPPQEFLIPDPCSQNIGGLQRHEGLSARAARRRVLELLDAQPEFKTPIRDYLAALVDQERIDDGRVLLEKWHGTLHRIEARYGEGRVPAKPQTLAAAQKRLGERASRKPRAPSRLSGSSQLRLADRIS